MEPRGGIEPPHVHGVVHGRRFRFCYCTRHIKHHHKMMLCPAYTGHLWSHREESNLQPTDYKTVALPVELRWHMCASRLDCHTSTNADSFQRDSAGAGHSCHRFRLHDRRASCPFSGAVRRSRLPGIVSFHRHPPPEGGILHTVGAAAAPPPPPPCEGGRGVNKSGSAGAYAPTLPFSHIPCSPIPSRGNHSNFFCEIMKSYIAFGSSVLPSK